jgi:hypothetical protein
MAAVTTKARSAERVLPIEILLMEILFLKRWWPRPRVRLR